MRTDLGMKKSFIITIDTEGDNLWEYKDGQSIQTENSRYIPRFQELCEEYGFVPTYLINYEMANDDYLVDYINGKLFCDKCCIGTHLHAWNTPPIYELPYDETSGLPYLVEYPDYNLCNRFLQCREPYPLNYSNQHVVLQNSLQYTHIFLIV